MLLCFGGLRSVFSSQKHSDEMPVITRGQTKAQTSSGLQSVRSAAQESLAKHLAQPRRVSSTRSKNLPRLAQTTTKKRKAESHIDAGRRRSPRTSATSQVPVNGNVPNSSPQKNSLEPFTKAVVEQAIPGAASEAVSLNISNFQAPRDTDTDLSSPSATTPSTRTSFESGRGPAGTENDECLATLNTESVAELDDALLAAEISDDGLPAVNEAPPEATVPKLSLFESLPGEIMSKILVEVIEPDPHYECTNLWPCENHGHRDARSLATVSTSIKASLMDFLSSWGAHPRFAYLNRPGIERGLAVWRPIFREFGLKSTLLNV